MQDFQGVAIRIFEIEGGDPAGILIPRWKRLWP